MPASSLHLTVNRQSVDFGTTVHTMYIFEYGQQMIRFEWNQTKALANRQKHGVSFAEAISVFYDEWAVQFFGEENSEHEDRYLLLGKSVQLRILLISYCELEELDVIRLISARKATINERKHYSGGGL